MKFFDKNKGFTLIELVVVIAVFLLVVGAAVGIFISIVQSQKRMLSEQELLNQTSYAMEYMSKAMRMAKRDDTGDCIDKDYVFLLTRPDNNGFYDGIKFINANDGSCEEFFFDGLVLNELKGPGGISNGNESNAMSITSTKLKINSIRFGINGKSGCSGDPGDPVNSGPCPRGAALTDGIQPRVTISAEIQIEGDAKQPTRNIQTTVSQRTLNMPQ